MVSMEGGIELAGESPKSVHAFSGHGVYGKLAGKEQGASEWTRSELSADAARYESPHPLDGSTVSDVFKPSEVSSREPLRATPSMA